MDPITKEEHWFDQQARATAAQLELLADWENLELDDLLDEGLSQRQVLFRLREVATPDVIPEHVLERRRERERISGMHVACRICTLNGWQCEGRITRHHFVPRWLMLELENYQAYSSRAVCTIPICVGEHARLHRRTAEDAKSIVPYLRDYERQFAHKLLDELREQRPKVFDLILAGEGVYSYEAQLISDYVSGKFASAENIYVLPDYIESNRNLHIIGDGTKAMAAN